MIPLRITRGMFVVSPMSVRLVGNRDGLVGVVVVVVVRGEVGSKVGARMGVAVGQDEETEPGVPRVREAYQTCEP